MSGFAVKAMIVLIVIMLIVVFIARFFRRVSPVKTTSQRLKMRIIVPLAGSVLLAVGFMLALVSFASRYTHELLPMRIAAGVTFVTGACVLIAYRNWYVEPGAHEVHFRTIFGREKHIVYSNIASYRMTRVAGQPRLIVRSSGGDQLAVNPGRYDMSALIAAAEFNDRNGRWPARGELLR